MTSVKKIYVIIGFVIAFTLPAQSLLAQPNPEKPRSAVAITAGSVVKVRRAGSESFVGTLEPTRKSIVGAAVDGRVVSFDLKPGDPVKADSEWAASVNPDDGETTFVGQPVMQLRTGTLDIEISAAEIRLKLARRALEELEISLPKEIELASANAQVADAGLQYSASNHKRAQQLGKFGDAISQGELEQALSEYLADQASANAARIGFEKLKATQELQLIQSRLRVESSEQEVAQLQDMKAKYTIRAPFKGLVTRTLTDVGEWVTKGQPIIEVVQLNPIEMIINAPQEHLFRLQESLSTSSEENPLIAEVEIEGYGEPLQGRVRRIVPQADLRSRTFPIRIEIENPTVGNKYALNSGMLGRATLLVGTEQDMLMVKKDALVLAGTSVKVFKIIAGKTTQSVVEVPVETGTSIGEWIQVIGDLTEKDKVVLEGNERLQSDQAIKVTSFIGGMPD